MPQSSTIKSSAIKPDKDLSLVEPVNSAVDQVIESIKAGIQQGRYVPGQRLVELDDDARDQRQVGAERRVEIRERRHDLQHDDRHQQGNLVRALHRYSKYKLIG